MCVCACACVCVRARVFVFVTVCVCVCVFVASGLCRPLALLMMQHTHHPNHIFNAYTSICIHIYNINAYRHVYK